MGGRRIWLARHAEPILALLMHTEWLSAGAHRLCDIRCRGSCCCGRRPILHLVFRVATRIRGVRIEGLLADLVCNVRLIRCHFSYEHPVALRRTSLAAISLLLPSRRRRRTDWRMVDLRDHGWRRWRGRRFRVNSFQTRTSWTNLFLGIKCLVHEGQRDVDQLEARRVGCCKGSGVF